MSHVVLLMRKGRKLLLWLVSIFTVGLLVFAGAVFYVSSNLKKIVTDALNEQLNAKVTVQQLDVTVWAQFPKVSLRFQEIAVQSKLKGVEPLGEAAELLLAFSVWDMLAGKYNMQEIALNNGALLLERSPQGATWDIFHASKETTSTEKFKLDLHRIMLNNVRVIYRDKASGQEHEFQTGKLTLAGAFSDADFTLEADGKIRINQLRFDRLRLFRDKDLEITTELNVQEGGDKITLGTTRLDIEGLKLMAEGSLEKQTVYKADLHLKGEDLDVLSFLGILPDQVRELLSDYKSKGNFYFDGTLKGALQQPHMHVSAGFSKASLQHPDMPKAITGLSAKVIFDNGSQNRLSDAVLQVSDINALFGSGELKGSLSLSNLLDPEMEAHLDSRLQLEELAEMIYLPGVRQLKGAAKVHFDYKGLLEDLKDPRKVANSGATGSASLEKFFCVLDTPTLKVEASRLEATLDKGGLSIQDFEGSLNEQQLTADIAAVDLLPYLFSEGKRLKIDADVDFVSLNLDQLLPGSASTGAAAGNDKGMSWPRDLDIKAKLKADQFSMGKVKATQVKAHAELDQTGLLVEELSAKTMEGSCKLDGKLNAHQNGAMDLQVSGALKDINLKQLFASFDNFGQQEITAEHISGKLQADIAAFIPFDNKGRLLDQQLTTVADLDIKNGQLTGYKPLESLSRFADINDLKNLQFASLKNRITVKNKVIAIPDMEVKNNALNLFVAGEHDFDNNVDYRFRIKLGDVLSRKHKERHPEEDFGEVEEDGRKGITLYISMKGPLSNLKITYDRMGVKAKLKEDAKKEKQSLKELFKEELGEPDLHEQGFIEEEEETPRKPLFPKRDKEKAPESATPVPKSQPKSVDLEDDIPQ